MSFKSNFDAVRWVDGTLAVHGISEGELGAAQAIYVGLCPVPPATGAIEWKTVDVGAQWSARYAARSQSVELNQPKLAIGVAFMKAPEKPFVWGEILLVEEDGVPIREDGEDPVPELS